jgi:hypothetical protein
MTGVLIFTRIGESARFGFGIPDCGNVWRSYGGGDGTTTLFPVSRDSRHACALGRRAETLGIGLHHVEFQENVYPSACWLDRVMYHMINDKHIYDDPDAEP